MDESGAFLKRWKLIKAFECSANQCENVSAMTETGNEKDYC
jgi:hypothetical protein